MVVYHFQLNLTPDEFLDYYRGVARDVLVQSQEGPTVQFPAGHLQSFVTRDGVQGFFELTCDDQNKFVELQRLSES